jgi:hypothetical protein
MDNSLYQVKLKCPVCGAAFKTSRVRSKSCAVESRDTDFCVYYKDYNPILYEAAVCAKCGYAAMLGSFNEISPEDARTVHAKISGGWSQRDFGSKRSIEDALDAYKLALYCCQLRKSISIGVLASICMRLAWLYRMAGDLKEESRFLGYALEQYGKMYDRGKTPEKMDEITLIYLIGELNRRLGKSKDAVVWFSMVVSHKMSRKRPLIVKMAREQWSLVRSQGEGRNRDE